MRRRALLGGDEPYLRLSTDVVELSADGSTTFIIQVESNRGWDINVT